jgi:phospholipid/cholesterol/gamma-HCH transport system substrate-binding protein
MKFKIRFAYQIVGVFIIVGLGFLVFIVVSVGASQRWFAKNYYYSTQFPSAGGLSVGMGITFKGFQIGRVSQIELNENNQVDVQFYIYDTYIDKVYQDSIIQLVSNPLGLGGGLVFHQGRNPTDPPPEFSVIPSWQSKEARQLVEQNRVIVPRQEDAIVDLLQQIDPILTNVNVLLISLDEMVTTINATFAGRATGPVADLVSSTTVLIGELQEVSQNVTGITRNLEATTAEFADPTGMVPKLLGAHGSVPQFLDDDGVLYDSVVQMLLTLDQTLANVLELSEFMTGTTPQISSILEESRETLEVTQDVLTGIRNNPLIRGGIPERVPQPVIFGGYRDEEF